MDRRCRHGQVLQDAVTGADIAIATSEGLDFGAALAYGRKMGNPALENSVFMSGEGC